MRTVRHLAATLLLALAVIPANAASDKDRRDCEQVTNPGLKVAACTRLLDGNNLGNESKAFRHEQRRYEHRFGNPKWNHHLYKFRRRLGRDDIRWRQR